MKKKLEQQKKFRETEKWDGKGKEERGKRKKVIFDVNLWVKSSSNSSWHQVDET